MILIAAFGDGIATRLRDTLPSKPGYPEDSPMRRRGAIYVGSNDPIVIADIAVDRQPAGHATAELAWYLGRVAGTSSLLLVNRDPTAERWTLADRVDGEASLRESVPDIVTYPGEEVDLAGLSDPLVHAAFDWALRRMPPHAVWAARYPERAAAASRHRGVRALVAALRDQSS